MSQREVIHNAAACAPLGGRTTRSGTCARHASRPTMSDLTKEERDQWRREARLEHADNTDRLLAALDALDEIEKLVLSHAQDPYTMRDKLAMLLEVEGE